MKKNDRIKDSRFPRSLFLTYLAGLLIMGGLHFGLLFGMLEADFPSIIMVHIILAYWGAVASGLALYTRRQIRKVYEEPMHKLAEAASKIASGDFGVRIEQSADKKQYDYIDVMISDFNIMAEELGNIETLRVDFFSNVSHEIKTPIAVIQNSAEMLKKGGTDSKQQQEYIENISNAVKRLSGLITNILRLNKLERQDITPAITEFDLSEQLVQSALMFENVWEEKQIEFDADIADERKMIHSDAELLPLIWNNLLSNAFKFTPSGGTVKLSERTENGYIIVTVEDSGCGMNENTKKHIFDKFYQGDISHSTEGNGLGLALALRVLQITGGTVSVESEEGKGSVFTVTLPDNN